MASDFVHFLLILYLIYISDCFVFARASEVLLFSRMKGAKWRAKSTDAAGAIGGRFWLLRPLLLPLGSSYRLAFPRYSLGRDGFCSASPLSRSARMGGDVRYAAYDAVESVEIRDDALVVNGEVWFKGTKTELAEAKAAVESVIGSADRPAAVRLWIESFFEAGCAATVRIGEVEDRTNLLNLFCSVYSVWLLLFLPVALFLFTPVRLLWSVAVPMLLLHLVCGGLFLRAHARLLPAERYLRWETFFKMFLCPPMMIRACDPVADHAGIPGDAVAVLLAATDEKVWRLPVQSVWRRLIPCQRTSLAPDAARAMDEYAAAYRDAMKRALEDVGFETAGFEVDAACVPGDHRFCPCCATVYRADIDVCSDCGGLPLLEGRKG